MDHFLIHEINLPNYSYVELVKTSYYVLNKVLLRPSLNKTPYKIFKNKKPNINYFIVFRIEYIILNIKYNFENFDAKSIVKIFLAYFT